MIVAVTLIEGLIGLMVALVGLVPSLLAYRKSQQIDDVPADAGVEGGWDVLVDRLLEDNRESRKTIRALEARIIRRDEQIDQLEAEVRALQAEVRELAKLVNET
jgi:uncharacterized protein YlxW (UPF0749 family)